MKHLSRIALLAALLLPFCASADMAPTYPKTGSMVPIKESPIMLTKEIVKFEIPKMPQDSGNMPATATFWMKNPTTRDITIDSIFPLLLADGQTKYASNVSVTVDGKAVAGGPQTDAYPVRINSQLSLDTPTTEGYEFPLTVAAGKTAIVVITFDSPYISAELGGTSLGFQYLLASGAGWAGPIGSATLTLDYPYPLQKGWLGDNVTSTVNSLSSSLVYTNLEPTADDAPEFEILNPVNAKQIIDAQSLVSKSPNVPASYDQLAAAYKSIIFYHGTRPAFAVTGYWDAALKAAILRYGTLVAPKTAIGAIDLATLYSDNFSAPCEAGCTTLTDETRYDQLAAYITTRQWSDEDKPTIVMLAKLIADRQKLFADFSSKDVNAQNQVQADQQQLDADQNALASSTTSTILTPPPVNPPSTPVVASQPPQEVVIPGSENAETAETAESPLAYSGIIAGILAVGAILGAAWFIGKKK